MKPRDPVSALLKVGEPNRSPQISSRSQVEVVRVFDARSLSYATGCLVASFVAKLGASRFRLL